MGSRLASALSFSHVDVGEAFQSINHIIAEKDQQVGVVYGIRRWRSKPQVVGSRPATALSFSFIRRRRRVSIYQSLYRRFPSSQHFFTCRRRGRVSIYQSYYGREEMKYNRSEWCSGRALTFKTTGRGFGI